MWNKPGETGKIQFTRKENRDYISISETRQDGELSYRVNLPLPLVTSLPEVAEAYGLPYRPLSLAS